MLRQFVVDIIIEKIIGYAYNIGINNTNKKDPLNNISRTHRLKLSSLAFYAMTLMVFVGVLLFALEKTHVIDLAQAPSKSTAPSGPTEAQQKQQTKTDAQAKQNYLDSVAKSDASSDEKTPSSVSQASASTSMAVTASQSGNSVTVLTKLQGISSGTCEMVATNGSASTTQSAQIIYQPEFSSCAGFSLQVGKIGAGKWNVSVTAITESGASLTKTASLEVK